VEKGCPIIYTASVIFTKNLHQVNIRLIGENSPNLVTLIVARVHAQVCNLFLGSWEFFKWWN
jgi:hypothetical protein